MMQDKAITNKEANRSIVVKTSKIVEVIRTIGEEPDKVKKPTNRITMTTTINIKSSLHKKLRRA